MLVSINVIVSTANIRGSIIAALAEGHDCEHQVETGCVAVAGVKNKNSGL